MYTEPLYYILATQICLALFWIFYRIVLARRKTLALNRYFLLTSVALSFLIPALSIPVAEPYGIMFEAAGQTIETVTPQEEVSSPASFDWGKALLLIQLIGSTAVLSFLVAGILRLRRLTYHATLIQNGKIRIYSLQAPDLAFSFFNRIYLSTADRDETTLRQIVAHETAHIHPPQSGHRADLCTANSLLVESVRMVVETFAARSARIPSGRLRSEQRQRCAAIYNAYAQSKRTQSQISGVCQWVLQFTHQKTFNHDYTEQIEMGKIQSLVVFAPDRCVDALLFVHGTTRSTRTNNNGEPHRHTKHKNRETGLYA